MPYGKDVTGLHCEGCGASEGDLQSFTVFGFFGAYQTLLLCPNCRAGAYEYNKMVGVV
jgi:hypothetical protein